MRQPGSGLTLATLCVPASAAASLACADTDSSPPMVEDARFVDRWTVVVRFSEPIAAPTDVDPASHFRLGAGLVIADDDGSDLSVYYDLAHHFPEGLPGQAGADATGPWQRHGFTEVASISPGEQPDELRLRLSYPVEDYVCDAVAEATTLGIPAAIHLHYAEASFPRITDTAGNPLADIGEWWVNAAFAATAPGAFAQLDPRVPIPCAFPNN